MKSVVDKINEFGESVEIPEILFESGVYFLTYGRQIVYIGSSINMYKRIQTHRKQGVITFTKMYAISVHPKLMAATESALIYYFKPKYNTKGKVYKHRKVKM